MKRFMMIAALIAGIAAVSSEVNADDWHGGGRSNLGISIGFGNGYSGFHYNRGGYYGDPYWGPGGGWGGGWNGGWGGYGGYYPPAPIYYPPVWDGHYHHYHHGPYCH